MDSPDPPVKTHWTDRRFALDADSLESAGDRVDGLIEGGKNLGFVFEFGQTTSEPPADA